MKKIVLFVFCLSVTAALHAEPTLDQILERYAQARGGRTAWRDLQGLEIKGQYSAFSERNSFQAALAPQRLFRFETTIRGGRTAFGHDTQGPWWIEPVFGLSWARRTGPPFDALLTRWALFAPPLLDPQDAKLEWLGAGDIDGQPTYQIKLTWPDGTTETWHLDQSTSLELAVDSTTYDYTQTNTAIAERAYFSDFRAVGPVKIPFKVEKEYLARYTLLQIEAAQVKIFPPDFFRMPTVAAMSRLKGLAGAWKVTVETPARPGQPWVQTPGESTISAFFDGNGLDEDLNFAGNGDRTAIKRRITATASAETYVLAEVDDQGFAAEIFDGVVEGETIVFKPRLAPAAPDAAPTPQNRRVLSWQEGGFQIEAQQSEDGATWSPVLRMIYRKL